MQYAVVGQPSPVFITESGRRQNAIGGIFVNETLPVIGPSLPVAVLSVGRQYIVVGGLPAPVFINESGIRQAVTGGVFVNETLILGTPIAARLALTTTLKADATQLAAGPGFGIVLGSAVLDGGLGNFALANKILLCAGVPVSYADANAKMLGTKNSGIGNVFAAISSWSDGRYIVSVPITDGVVSSTGDATCWAIVDDANSRLLATGPMIPATVHLISGRAFALGSLTVNLIGGGLGVVLREDGSFALREDGSYELRE